MANDWQAVFTALGRGEGVQSGGWGVLSPWPMSGGAPPVSRGHFYPRKLACIVERLNLQVERGQKTQQLA